MFRVVPDQLRISEGWVRCGQCDEVFDANAHLQHMAEQASSPVSHPAPLAPPLVDAPDAEPAPPVEASSPAVPAAPPVATGAQPAYDWGPLLVEEGPSDTAPIDTGAEVTIDFPTEQALPALPEDAFLEQNPHELPVAEESLATQLASARVDDWLREEQLAEQTPASVPAHGFADVQAPLSFMPVSKVPSRRWLGPKVLLSLCVLLASLLMLQWLLSQRNQLAARVPALRPVLHSGCALLGCTISAPQQIEAIAIESSAFTSVKPGVYLLGLSLKNASAMELETPALELTLTDMQDQTLLRRVILPGELAASQAISAGAEITASLPIRLQTDALSKGISGYKLLAFYP
jgi:predicted Zn finger-like uncharacterized protein